METKDIEQDNYFRNLGMAVHATILSWSVTDTKKMYANIYMDALRDGRAVARVLGYLHKSVGDTCNPAALPNDNDAQAYASMLLASIDKVSFIQERDRFRAELLEENPFYDEDEINEMVRSFRKPNANEPAPKADTKK